ncbi:MAG: helix-turn-helix domain-containing protein [Fibrobacterota bacterium]|nr:helix-turn-helix domain-containing protein [Fibrobacterota bacterium]
MKKEKLDYKLTPWEKSLQADLAAGKFADVKQSKKERTEIRKAASHAGELLPRRQAFYDIRKGRGMTQGEMAKALKVSIRTVQSWEIGAREIPEPMLILAELLRDVPAVRKRLLAA